jgi:hypothetical protein
LVFTPVRRVCALVALSLVVLAGCKVDAHVDVRLRADGTGTVTTRVTLDADAVHRLTRTKPLADAVPLADLRKAGWTVSSWSVAKDGSATVTVAHPFTGQDDLAARLVDLAGSTGVLHDPVITNSRGFFGAKDEIAVSVDLRDLSTGVQSDAGVLNALKSAGVDVNALDEQLHDELDKSLDVTVAVHAPGGETKTISLNAGDQATASASTAQTYTSRIVLLAIGIALLVLALLLTAASLATRSRRRRAS